jgi:hypothetical protein
MIGWKMSKAPIETMTDLVERLRIAAKKPATVESWRDLVKEAFGR